MKKIIYIILSVVGGIFALIVISGVIRFTLIGDDVIEPGKNAPDVENMTYVFGAKNFVLSGGKSALNEFSIYGEPVYGDLDGDRDIDAATFVLNNDKDSFMGYYAVLVLNNDGVFSPTNLMFLSRDLGGPMLRIDENRAVFGYKTKDGLDEKSTVHYIQKNVWINLDKTKNEIGEWVKDLEGESAVDEK